MTSSVAAATVHALERALHGAARLRVRALHLPPSPWNGNKDGEFGAVELDDGSLGLSYLLLDDALGTLAADRGRGIAGVDALDLARDWVAAAAPARRALGFAAVNALTRHLYDRAGYAPPPAPDSIGGLDPQPHEHIGMVGFFPPLVAQVTACGARLTVVELRPQLAGERDGFRITLDARELARCDKVLATSTVLLNDTLDDVLGHCRDARAFAMIGPGAACLPDALFARGVTVQGGVWIDDAEAFKRALVAGEPWGRCGRKFAVRRDDYPGAVALARRSGTRAAPANR
jgi:hypothetical protein